MYQLRRACVDKREYTVKARHTLVSLSAEFVALTVGIMLIAGPIASKVQSGIAGALEHVLGNQSFVIDGILTLLAVLSLVAYKCMKDMAIRSASEEGAGTKAVLLDAAGLLAAMLPAMWMIVVVNRHTM